MEKLLEKNSAPVENPIDYLKKLEDSATKTMKQVKKLHSQMLSVISNFNSCGEVILFRNTTLNIKEGPHCIIKGIEIYAFPWDNNHASNMIYCMVVIKCRLIKEFDPEHEDLFTLAQRKEIIDDLKWNISLFNLRLEKYENEGYGIIKDTCDDSSKIIIEPYSEFLNLKKVIYEGCARIGYL